MAQIFLCHASEDKPQVREVYRQLKALGFEPWLDEEDLLPSIIPFDRKQIHADEVAYKPHCEDRSFKRHFSI